VESLLSAPVLNLSRLAHLPEVLFVSRSRNDRHNPLTKDNIGRRLKATIKRANKKLARLGIEPISERVSPHSLRRTYASFRVALRDDPVYIAEQGGWTDPRFALSVYAKAAKRRERLSGSYRAAFDHALQWAEMGRIGDRDPIEIEQAGEPHSTQTASSSHNQDAQGG
jgi:integrase